MVLFFHARHPQDPPAEFGDPPEAPLHAGLWVGTSPFRVPGDALHPSHIQPVDFNAIDQGVRRTGFTA